MTTAQRAMTRKGVPRGPYRLVGDRQMWGCYWLAREGKRIEWLGEEYGEHLDRVKLLNQGWREGYRAAQRRTRKGKGAR